MAGTGTRGFGGDGGAASAAMLAGPTGVALDCAGNLYIADGNHRIRRVDATTGNILTVAGTGMPGFGGDGGLATAARLFLPADVAVARDGKVYIADTRNHRIRRLSPWRPAALFGESLRLPLESLAVPGESSGDLSWSASSSDPAVAQARVDDGLLVVEPMPGAEGKVDVEATATDANGHTATVRFTVEVEFHTPARTARGWRGVLLRPDGPH